MRNGVIAGKTSIPGFFYTLQLPNARSLRQEQFDEELQSEWTKFIQACQARMKIQIKHVFLITGMPIRSWSQFPCN